MLKKIIIAPIYFYKYFISPLKVPTCRFYPSCSTYVLQAVEKYGVLKGIFLGICRIGRCHPWHPGGHDPVR